MSRDSFPQYTTDYISGVMSLRDPQIDSIKILEKILDAVPLSKLTDLQTALNTIHNLYPICTDFEREFPSLTFALATGVGKTRLMGAFIAFLYTQYDIKNFFIVAPGTTVYEKLKNDFGNPSNPKYVFNGLGCFVNSPRIIADDDYRNKQLSLFDSEINIFIFNIDKFNKEDVKMKDVNEYLGQSFYDTLANLNDLVLVMDESHHYRAEAGAKALENLHPLLGLELTATPIVTKTHEKFKNVVYEYPLSKAIEDGYTRTPFAVTRSDINFYNFGDEQIDKMMLQDGILCHENAKRKLVEFAYSNKKPIVKPFMLVVCKDTEHAIQVETFVKSKEFCEGKYENKTITVHSKKTGAESDFNMKLLLDVERSDNPIEIVIHVNMLKEGWDVNNLYTIVPLRTAASKILREQMVGRGLRLPYGKRTEDKDVDAVMLTAHDKFKEILEEAQKGDSIFKAGNVIRAEELQGENIVYTQMDLSAITDNVVQNAYEETKLTQNEINTAVIKKAYELVNHEVINYTFNNVNKDVFTANKSKEIANKVVEKLKEDKDLGKVFEENKNPFWEWMVQETVRTHKAVIDKFIPIPKIKVTDVGIEEYRFIDFDLDLLPFNHVPIENDMLIQNLGDLSDQQRIKAKVIDFEIYDEKKAILELLRQKPEIDYEKISDLLYKLIKQVCDHYRGKFGTDRMRNVIMMHKNDISDKIYVQMMKNFFCENGFVLEEVISPEQNNVTQIYTMKESKDLFENYDGNIRSIVFTGIKKGVFANAKFDSNPELIFARVLERDTSTVVNWLRPASAEFNITYNRGKKYEPDFVVETTDIIYLIEIKRDDEVDKADVVAKKNRAVKYCEVVSKWGAANGYKEWKHLFIPATNIYENSSFEQFVNRFVVEDIE